MLGRNFKVSQRSRVGGAPCGLGWQEVTIHEVKIGKTVNTAANKKLQWPPSGTPAKKMKFHWLQPTRGDITPAPYLDLADFKSKLF